MRTESLDIGTKDFSVTASCQLADDIADCMNIAKQSSEYVVACFNRAHRINLQERSGAREHVRTAIAGKDAGLLKSESFISKLVGECNEIIAKYVPGARRAVVHTPPTIKVEANKKTFSLADFQKMAEAQGFKITVGE